MANVSNTEISLVFANAAFKFRTVYGKILIKQIHLIQFNKITLFSMIDARIQ